MKRASSERQTPVRRGRISDLAIEEPTPINPLGQHLPFPMNVNAPQDASPQHEYLMFEGPAPELSRRRATLPNVHTVSETQSLNGRAQQLESWSEQPDGDLLPSPGIGIALSSPPHTRQSTDAAQEKRRSRSAGNLRELIKGRPSVERRRSEEIRYWRNSYASGSVYSTATPRPRTAQTIETVQSAAAQEDLPKLEEVTTKSVAVHAPTVVTQKDHSSLQVVHPLPVEAFNFGNLRSDFSDDEDLEQPEAPTARHDKRLSIEDRVKYLEENMRTLDASVRRMSGQTNRQTIILENAPKGRRSRNRSSSASSQRQGSHHSISRSSNNPLGLRQYGEEKSPPASPVHPPLSAVNENPAQQRELTPPDFRTQLDTLKTALQHEVHARQMLETQVSTLQRDLADLHALVHKFINTTSPNYPTPSPDAIITSNETNTPRASEGRGRSWTEGSLESDVEDVISPDHWATPKESTSSGFF